MLRVKLAYPGLAVADLLGLFDEIPPQRLMRHGLTIDGRCILLSIEAGCDLQALKGGPEIAQLVVRGIKKELDGGSLTKERVDEALGRIRAAKKRLNRPSGKLRARGFDRLAREFEDFAAQFRAKGEKIA